MINFVDFDAVVEAIRNDVMLRCRMVIEPLEGSSITVTNSDLVSSTFSLDRYCQSSDSLEVGSACAAELSFALLNHDGKFNEFKFEGAKIDLYIIDPTNPRRSISIGKFTVDVKPKQLNTISIVALDCMVVMDKLIDWEKFVWQTTIGGLLDNICADCGVTLSPTAKNRILSAGVNYLKAAPVEEKMTYRQLLQQVLEYTCRNAYIDENGELDFAWYKNTKPNIDLPEEERPGGFKINPSDRFQSSVEEKSLVPRMWVINSVDENADEIKTELPLNFDENDAPYGDFDFVSEGNSLMEYNPIPLTSSGLLTKSYWRLQNAYLGSVRKFSAEILPFFFLMPMDEIIFVTKDGEEISTTITHTNFRLNGGMKIECKLPAPSNSGYASLGAMTARERYLLNQIRVKANQNVSDRETIDKLTQRENALLSYNKAVNNGVFLNKTEYEGQVYYHNGDTLETSTYIMIQNSQGTAWTNKGGWDSTKDDPVSFEYTIAADGTSILSDIFAYTINADFIRVQDLSALSASIGGWIIGNNMLYSQSNVEQIEGVDTSGYVVFKNSYSLLDSYVLTVGSSRLGNYDDARFAITLDGVTRVGATNSLHTKIYPEGIGIGTSDALSANQENVFAVYYDNRSADQSIKIKVAAANGLSINMGSSPTKRFEFTSDGKLYARDFVSNYTGGVIEDRFAGFTHYRKIEYNSVNVNYFCSTLGIGVIGSGTSKKPTTALELKDINGNAVARLDFHQSNTSDYYADLVVQGASTGLSTRLSFKGDEIRSQSSFNANSYRIRYTPSGGSAKSGDFARISGGNLALGLDDTKLKLHATGKIIFSSGAAIEHEDEVFLVNAGGHLGFSFGVYNTSWMSTTSYTTSCINASQNVLTLAAPKSIVLDAEQVVAQKGAWKEVDVSSTENIKKNISRTNTVLSLFDKNNSEIYSYNLINEKRETEISSDEFGTMSVPEETFDIEKNVSYGFVIGEGYVVPPEVLAPDGQHINLYSMASLNWKATQELYEELLNAKQRIEELEKQLIGG